MAAWTAKYKNSLPDSAFLIPKYRALPYKDRKGQISLSHVRNALARANQVKGVPQKDINAAIKKAEKILLEHGGYERTMRPNFFRSKPKKAPTAAELAAEKKAAIRSTREWKSKYNYYKVSEGYPKAEAERLADESYEAYKRQQRDRSARGVARNPSKRKKSSKKRRVRRNGSGVSLYANPYDTSQTGFYFKDFDEFQEKFDAKYKKSRVEEYEIDFIDGDEIAQLLFEGMKVHQGNIEEYFEKLEQVEDMEDYEKPGFFYLVEDRDLESALENYEEVMMFEGSLEDAAYDYSDQMGEIDQANADMYFDYEKFGRDLRIGGDLTNSLEEDAEYAESEGDEDEAERLREEIERLEGLSDQELGEDYIESVGSVEDALGDRAKDYFDYEAFGRDANINGDWHEFRFDGVDYVVLNAAQF